MLGNISKAGAESCLRLRGVGEDLGLIQKEEGEGKSRINPKSGRPSESRDSGFGCDSSCSFEDGFHVLGWNWRRISRNSSYRPGVEG